MPLGFQTFIVTPNYNLYIVGVSGVILNGKKGVGENPGKFYGCSILKIKFLCIHF